jgi:hypothetical protein
MSYYVKRSSERRHDIWTDRDVVDHREGWTGPIRSAKQAEREATAWRDVGWSAEVLPSTPEVRAQVRAWTKANRQWSTRQITARS